MVNEKFSKLLNSNALLVFIKYDQKLRFSLIKKISVFDDLLLSIFKKKMDNKTKKKFKIEKKNYTKDLNHHQFSLNLKFLMI